MERLKEDEYDQYILYVLRQKNVEIILSRGRKG
jgi:hypothetical protein